ncbi:unnamed protein product [Caenorhabditis angaria]|uniref:Serpentine Receptor, class H n=1 Tax=Caenorhabditis angaria TaxID=860376 RepID=A0A9P1N836_9PELO|nr:unnamed protein product [Caenorhabditis angaria]
MKNTKKVLLHLHFCTFLLDLVINFLVTPYIYLPTSAVTLYGILYDFFDLPFKPLCYFGQFSLYYISSVMAMSMVRLYQTRHSMVATIKYKITRKLTLLIYYTYMYSFGAIFMMLYFFDDTPTDIAKRYFLEIYPCPPKEYYEDRTLVITTDIFFAIFCMLISTCNALLHGFYFAFVGAYHLVNVKSITVSATTKKFQLTFLYNVSIQMAVPFIAILIPIIIFDITLMLSTHSQLINNIIVLTLSIHGFLSNISLICLHKPYRDYTNQLIFKENSKIESLSSVRTVMIIDIRPPRN